MAKRSYRLETLVTSFPSSHLRVAFSPLYTTLTLSMTRRSDYLDGREVVTVKDRKSGRLIWSKVSFVSSNLFAGSTHQANRGLGIVSLVR